MMTQFNILAGIKVLVFFLCLTPFSLLLYDAVNNNLGANPIETLHFRLGDWALRFLCICLAMTPLKIFTKWNWPIRYRRMFGLYSFFYAAMHFLVYIGLDLSFSWEQFVDEIPKSPYIIVGLFTFSILTLLASTSTKYAQRRLKKNWKRLHRLVYLAGITAVIHYFWLVKSDYREPILYASIIGVLYLIRIVFVLNKRYAWRLQKSVS